jgi:hypothetical protein
VVYDANPVYTLNISAPGSQSFDLSYLMYNAANWKPVYDLHLLNDSVLVRASAVLSNQGGEDLKNVRLKLVAGLPLAVQPSLAKAAPQINQRYAEAAPVAAAMDYAAAPSSSGELETLYIFELEGRKDLVMDKEIGFPLFEEESPGRREKLCFTEMTSTSPPSRCPTLRPAPTPPLWWAPLPI